MTTLVHDEPRETAPGDAMRRWDDLFDDWARMWPLRMVEMFRSPWDRMPFARVSDHDAFLRVDEFREGDTLVVRAELPGLDPERDITISLADHRLRIEAHHREDEETAAPGYLRRELRAGYRSRDLPVPEGVAEGDVTATYTDGVLEVRIAVPSTPASTIPVQRG